MSNPDYSKLIKKARRTGGDSRPSFMIARGILGAGNENYNGTFKLGGNTLSNYEPSDRDLLNLYFNGDETGFEKYEGKPVTINGKTNPYKLYKGNILPMDTITLRPESKAAIDWYVQNQTPLRFISAVMADPAYAESLYSKYIGKELDDVGKATIYFKQNSDGTYYLDVVDTFDFDTVLGGKRIDRKVKRDSNENNGPFVLRQNIPVKFTREGVSDGTLLDDISMGRWLLKLDEVNKKLQGGTLAQQRAAENQRHSTLAKHYVLHPTLPNLAKAGYHWFKSKPGLGGQFENDNILQTGTAPIFGVKGVPSIEAIKKAEAIATGTKAVTTSKRILSGIENATAMETVAKPFIRRLTKEGLKDNQIILNLRQYPSFETPYNKIARKLFMSNDPAKNSEYLRLIENLVNTFRQGIK